MHCTVLPCGIDSASCACVVPLKNAVLGETKRRAPVRLQRPELLESSSRDQPQMGQWTSYSVRMIEWAEDTDYARCVSCSAVRTITPKFALHSSPPFALCCDPITAQFSYSLVV